MFCRFNFVITHEKYKKKTALRAVFFYEQSLPYDTSIMENTMTNRATVSPTPSTIR